MFEQPTTGQDLMTPQQITDICEGRDQTIAMWLDLYDHYHAIAVRFGYSEGHVKKLLSLGSLAPVL